MQQRGNLLRVLECVEENFLTQLAREPTREDDHGTWGFFVYREEPVGAVMVGGHLRHNNHEIYINF